MKILLPSDAFSPTMAQALASSVAHGTPAHGSLLSVADVAATLLLWSVPQHWQAGCRVRSGDSATLRVQVPPWAEQAEVYVVGSGKAQVSITALGTALTADLTAGDGSPSEVVRVYAGTASGWSGAGGVVQGEQSVTVAPTSTGTPSGVVYGVELVWRRTTSQI